MNSSASRSPAGARGVACNSLRGPVMYRLAAVFIILAVACDHARADVVINEIFYHAPDDLDDLQFIELHNTGAKAVNVAGWRPPRGVKHAFPANATIEANG